VHLTALVESPEHVCCRYRLTALRPYLEQAGHTLEIRAWPTRWWSRLTLGRALAQADVVIVQRKLLPWWQLLALRHAAPALVFDFDDAVFLRDSYAAKGLHSPQRQRRFAGLVRAAAGVAAGNAFLAEEAARWHGAVPVHVIPTCVETERYPLAAHDRSGPGTQLVWVGSSSTLKGLETARPLLEAIGQGCPGLSLKLICDRFLTLEHLPIVACPWAEATEADAIASADIGLSWVPDDDWSRGKCGLKVLQYMAAGLPVVANPVGVQVEMVEHGRTGFLAETPAQWIEAIRQLMHDPALRRSLGQAARRRVEADYHPRVAARHWLDLLTAVQRRRQAA